MQITICKLNEANLSKIVEVMYDSYQDRPKPKEMAEIAEILSSPEFEVSTLVLAKEGEEVIGWLLLLPTEEGRASINPFGAPPFVRSDHNWDEITSNLLSETKNWSKHNKRRVEFWNVVPNEGDMEERRRLESVGFQFRGESMDMTLAITHSVEELNLPAGFTIEDLGSENYESLYRVYHSAFMDEGARFFLDQSEQDRRAYFDDLVQMDLNREASSILLNGSEVIGFTLIHPYSNSENVLTCICVNPEYGGRGLGSAMLRATINKLYYQGETNLGLFTDVEMRAFAMYKKLGWVVAKRYQHFLLKH